MLLPSTHAMATARTPSHFETAPTLRLRGIYNQWSLPYMGHVCALHATLKPITLTMLREMVPRKEPPHEHTPKCSTRAKFGNSDNWGPFW